MSHLSGFFFLHRLKKSAQIALSRVTELVLECVKAVFVHVLRVTMGSVSIVVLLHVVRRTMKTRLLTALTLNRPTPVHMGLGHGLYAWIL